MKRTSDAIEILDHHLSRNPRLKRLVEEEMVNLEAAATIRDARHKLGWTQARLAKEVGTTQSVIARIESAEYRGHTLRMIENIAHAMGQRIKISFQPASAPASRVSHRA